MIHLRRATQDDVDAIRALVHAAYTRWVPLIGHEPRPMQADYAQAVARHIVDVHHAGGALAALIEMRPAPDHLLVVNVAVAPSWQGRGLGRALLRHAEAVAASLHLDEVRLYTNRLMTGNVRLYLRSGYGVTHEEDYGDGIVVHMSKTLMPPRATS